MKKGFTIIEILVVVGIMAIFLSYTGLTIINTQRRTYIDSTVNTAVSNIKTQQNKAMLGDAGASTTSRNYGIRFEQSRYILFHDTYTSSEATNSIIPLQTGIEFSNILFPQSELIFTKGSGEISGFTSNSNKVTIRNTQSGESKTITFNKYGTITSIE